MSNPHLKHLSKLPLAQRWTMIDAINETLIDLLCAQLFAEAMPAQPLPTETKDEMLAKVLAEVNEVLHG